MKTIVLGYRGPDGKIWETRRIRVVERVKGHGGHIVGRCWDGKLRFFPNFIWEVRCGG